MKKDSFTKILSSAAVIAAALCAGTTSAADLSHVKGPRTLFPFWPSFNSGSSSDYSWVAGDPSSTHLYEVRATASAGADLNALLADAYGRGQIGYDYKSYQTLLIRLDSDSREPAFTGSGGLPFPIGSFGVSVVPAERPGAARGSFSTPALAYSGNSPAYGSRQTTTLGDAMLSATLQGNPFLSADKLGATPLGWKMGGDLR